MKNPFKALQNETSALKKFRLILIAVLSVAVVTSAALAIFMIISGYSDENLWKATGTFGLFAGFSLIMLIQTSSLYRLEIWDKLITGFGIISSSLLVSLALDTIYEWRFYAEIFKGHEDFSNKFFMTAGVITAITSVLGLLRSSMRINGKIKVTTVILSVLLAIRILTDVWFPDLFSKEVEDYWYDENNVKQVATFFEPAKWWIDLSTILSILVGMSLVLSLVSHILGANKRKHKEEEIKEAGSDLASIKISQDTLKALQRKARADKLLVEDYLKKLLED